MFYLLEKVTMITAKFAREMARREGLTVSVALLRQVKADREIRHRRIISHS